MKKIATYLFVVATIFSQVVVACTDAKRSLQYRVAESSLVVEGGVIDQQSFWDASGTKIFTSNTFEVYKVFKGQQVPQQIELITEGGQMGNEIHTATPSLQVSLGDKGMLFVHKSHQTENLKGALGKSADHAYAGLDPYQSFIRYDEVMGQAIDLHTRLENVEQELYSKIEEYSQQSRIEKVAYRLEPKKAKAQKSSATPIIDCFTPNVVSAGTASIIRIEGSGFGSFDQGWDSGGKCLVEFADPNSGGSIFAKAASVNIITWTDSSVEVKVPTKAGTGGIRLTNASDLTAQSGESLEVIFAVKNVGTPPELIYLIGENGSGGYDFKYSTSSANSGVSFAGSQAVTAFERAVASVQKNLGLNVRSSGNTSTNSFGNDGENVIYFDNAASPITPLAKLYSQYNNCGNGWELAGFDMVFRRENTGVPQFTWFYSTGNPSYGEADLESVALHELAHISQLGHINNLDAVLFYGYTIGSVNRNYSDCNDKSGSYQVVDFVNTFTPSCSGNSSYQRHPSFLDNIALGGCPKNSGCGASEEPNQVLNTTVKIKVLLEGPYAGGGQMNTSLKDNNLLPIQQPFNRTPWFYNGNEGVGATNEIPSNAVDWVLLEARSESDLSIVESKAGFILNNGLIVDVDGSLDGIKFFQLQQNSDYHFVVRTRSHLAVMTSTAIGVPNASAYEFSASANAASGGGQLKQAEIDTYVLYAGDVDSDGVITVNDLNIFKSASSQINQYLDSDMNMDRIVTIGDLNIYKPNSSKIGYVEVRY